MRTVEEIKNEIEELNVAMQNNVGTETEVYTRIVGYYRSVRNWNKGKREEYKYRLAYTFDNLEIEKEPTIKVNPVLKNGMNAFSASVDNHKSAKTLLDTSATKRQESKTSLSYLMFTQESCRNCPPVKDSVYKLALSGITIDASTREGLKEAEKYDVMSTPTVIFFDSEKKELGRANSVDGIKKIVGTVRV